MKTLPRVSNGFAAVLCLAAPVAAAADDWPQWRGPQRNGHSRETGLLKEWAKEGPKLVWQVKDAGFGYGAPVVVGDALYLISNDGPDNEYVQARSAKDGKKLWSSRLGKVGNPDQQPSYPGSRTTPTVDGSMLFALGSDGDLACLDRSTGAVKWKKSLRADFGGQPGIWAYSESPLLDGNSLVCTPGGPQSTVVALDKRTGEVIWKTATPEADQAAYASPVIAQIGGVKQYVIYLQKGVVGLDAGTGKLLWRYEGAAKGSPANIPTPIVDDSMVYIASGITGGGAAAITRVDTGFSVEQKYYSKKLPNTIGGSVKKGPYLYGATATTFMCLDFSTGGVKWDERSIGPASLIHADGLLFLHGENGEVALLGATPEGYREKGRFSPPDQPERARTRAWAYPALANGQLYIRDLDRLWRFDVKGK